MVLMAASVAAWAAVEAMAAHLARAYSPYQVVFTRYVVHTGLVLASGWRAQPPPWHTRRLVTQVARSLLMVAMPACFVLATARGVAPSATLALFWFSPLVVLALSAPLLGEAVPRRAWLVTALACAAAAAACRPAALPGAVRALLPAGMAVSFALYVVMTRGLRDERTRTNLLYTALGPALVLAPVMPRVWVMPSPRDLALMGGIGAVGLAALWALDRATAAAPVSASAAVAPLQVAFAIALQAVESGHAPAVATMVAVMTIAAVSLYAWKVEPSPIAP
jgi:drug/metabolite transporter (DMT)-like permease